MGINICCLLPPPDHPLFGRERSSPKILKKEKGRGGFQVEFLGVGGSRR